MPALEGSTTVLHVERFAPGQTIARPHPGDFVLVRGQGWVSWAVYLFQGLRFRARRDRPYAYWSHVALVTSPGGRLVEVGPRGVYASSLEGYRGLEYHYVHVAVPGARRVEVARFAEGCVGQPYGTLSSVALGFFTLIGCPLAVPDRGQHHCAALVARALERATGERFARTPANMMPADLAKHFGITP
jgi:hypothetical protein